MRRALLALALLGPSPALADAVRTPAPIEGCPTGSVSSTPGLGLFHGAFAYCAPQLCAAGGVCPGRLECREVMLQSRLRSYSTGGGHGAPPGPRSQVTEIVGPCEQPAPGIVIPSGSLADSLGGLDVGEGCQRFQVCAPRGMGDPLGTTAPIEPPPEDPTAPPPVEPPAEAPEVAPEPLAEAAPPASPPPAAASPAATGCGCRAAGAGAPSLAWSVLALLAWRRPRSRRG